MKIDWLKREYVIDYVSSHLEDLIRECVIVNDAKYHHNTSYSSAPSIIKNNILSLEELTRRRLKRYSEETLAVMDDISSHANGSDGISLSVVGLRDINDDEFEYDPYDANKVDLLIQSDVSASRYSVNYGNEFIASSVIESEKIKSIDIRLAKYIELICSSRDGISFEEKLDTLVQRYNSLINIARILRQESLNIPIREMSYDNCSSLDVNMLASSPKLVLKK